MTAAPRANETADAIWTALIDTAPTTSAEIAMQTGFAQATVQTYLRGWEDEGRIARERDGTTVTWRLSKPPGTVGQSGMPATPQEAVWRTMRVHRQFTQKNLAQALRGAPKEPSEMLLRAYTQALLSAGYLKVLVKAQPARGIEARYQLIRDTGPLPPAVERRQVVRDQNEERVVAVKGARL